MVRGLKDPSSRWNLFFNLPLLDASFVDQTGFAAAASSTVIVSKSVTSPLINDEEEQNEVRVGAATLAIKGERERKMDSPKGWSFWPPPRNRCPVSTLDSNVALPVYRTFMAHKYQELSMISLLYYQETLTAEGGRKRGDQNCYLAQFYIFCPTPTSTTGVTGSNLTPEQLRNAGLPPIQSVGEKTAFLSRFVRTTLLAPKFNLPSGSSFAG